MGEYWHSGHLNALSLASFRGRELAYFDGVNNAQKAATLVVLDPARLGGAARELSGYQLTDFGAPMEEARVLFPGSCLTPSGSYNAAAHIFATGNGVVVDVWERVTSPHSPSIQYDLSSDLSLRQGVFFDGFVSEHTLTE